MVQVADEAVGGGAAEGEGVAPEVPLEDDDGVARGDDPDEVQCALAAGETGIEEGCGCGQGAARDKGGCQPLDDDAAPGKGVLMGVCAPMPGTMNSTSAPHMIMNEMSPRSNLWEGDKAAVGCRYHGRLLTGWHRGWQIAFLA